MKLTFTEIETSNLRVPDLKIEFTEGMNFLQIPNGTGKTTLLQLIRHSLSNNWDNLEPKEIKAFRRKASDSHEGFFKIGFKSKEDRYKLQINFDFSDGSFHVDTDTPSGKKRNKFDPPRDLKPFMTKNHVDIFIFSAQIAPEHFSEKSNVVEKAVGTFSGRLTVEKNIEDILKKFSSKHRGSTSDAKDKDTEKKLEILDVKLDELSELKNVLEEEIDKTHLKYDPLQAKVKAYQANTEKQRDKRDKLNVQLQDLRDEFKNLENEISLLVIRPSNVSKNFQKMINGIYSKLEKEKLPGTSSAFFDEIAEQDECICGTEITKDIKKRIISGKDKYLGDDDIAFVNAMKTSIADCVEGTAEKELKEKIGELKKTTLQIDDVNELIAESEEEAKEEALTPKELKSYQILFKQLEEYNSKLKAIQKSDFDDEYQRERELAKIIGTTIKNFIQNIPDAEWLQKHLQDKDAKSKGYKNANDNMQKVRNAIEEGISEAEDMIKDEIANSMNKMIRSIHTDGEFKVSSVDKAINLDGQTRGSGAQEVIAVSTFALSLLQRSSIDFPMIIDHPVKDIQNENRAELSNFLNKSTHQCICLVINSEKDGFIRDEDTRQVHKHVANSNFITAVRKKNAPEFPKDSIETDDGLISYEYKFFNSFKTSRE